MLKISNRFDELNDEAKMDIDDPNKQSTEISLSVLESTHEIKMEIDGEGDNGSNGDKEVVGLLMFDEEVVRVKREASENK